MPAFLYWESASYHIAPYHIENVLLMIAFRRRGGCRVRDTPEAEHLTSESFLI
jgi:hypothetical protein